MATAKQIDNLLYGLRRKYLARSNEEIVSDMILSDINILNRYDKLTKNEKLSLYGDAVVCTDGEATWEYVKKDNADLLELFF